MDQPHVRDGERQMLVKVRAAGVNNADLVRVQESADPDAAPCHPGVEVAGEVVTVPPGCRFAVGDRVMGLVHDGGQAEYVALAEQLAMSVPDGIGWAEAGGFPEAFITAHDALFTQGALRAGERVCVHGGAGGVGMAAVQLARAAGADVVATVRSAARHRDVEALGATVVPPDAFIDLGPYDVIIELVGSTNMPANITALNYGGRISSIGLLSGSVASIDLRALMRKQGRLSGSTLRTRKLIDKISATEAVVRDAVPLLSRGEVRVPICEAFQLGEVASAYDRFAGRGKFGKIVLQP